MELKIIKGKGGGGKMWVSECLSGTKNNKRESGTIFTEVGKKKNNGKERQTKQNANSPDATSACSLSLLHISLSSLFVCLLFSPELSFLSLARHYTKDILWILNM